ncbi:hypothetical protein [Spirosoma gilvum]
MSRYLYWVLFGILLLSAIKAEAQVEYGYSRTIRIYAPNFKPYNDIEGSPFVPGDSVQNGWLVYGRKQVPARLRYNSYSGEVEYVEGGKVLTPVNSVAEFGIIAADTLRFKKGFPAVGSWSPTDFYQLVYDGRTTKLVKRIVSVIKQNTETMANDFGKKRFQQRDEYFVWLTTVKPPADSYVEKLSEGTMKAVTMNKKTLLSLFPQKAEQIDQYLSDQKMKLKSWMEFANVLKYLDAL